MKILPYLIISVFLIGILLIGSTLDFLTENSEIPEQPKQNSTVTQEQKEQKEKEQQAFLKEELLNTYNDKEYTTEEFNLFRKEVTPEGEHDLYDLDSMKNKLKNMNEKEFLEFLTKLDYDSHPKYRNPELAFTENKANCQAYSLLISDYLDTNYNSEFRKDYKMTYILQYVNGEIHTYPILRPNFKDDPILIDLAIFKDKGLEKLKTLLIDIRPYRLK